jgi:1-acyl-sn-glycerol-3-phosphate acyltransferase
MIKTYIHTIISRILVVLLSAAAVIPVACIMCVPRRIRLKSTFLFSVIYWFYKALLWTLFIPIRIEGKEHIPTQPAIFVSNHQSSLDIPLVGSLVGEHPHLWLARSELMESWLFRLIIPIFAEIVEVGDPRKAMRSLLTILKTLNSSKAHLMIFPEGQRFTDGSVHEFFGGFVILAKKTGRPVVPVYIGGVNKVYPPNSFWLYTHPVTVVVGPPLIVGQEEDDEQFKQRVYSWFVRQAQQ